MELESVKKLQAECGLLRRKIKALRMTAGTVPARNLDGLPHAKSFDSVVEKNAVKILDLEKLLDEMERRHAAAILKLTDAIYSRVTSEVAAHVLYLRYVKLLPFKVIAVDLNCSEQSVFYFHRRGRKEYLANAA